MKILGINSSPRRKDSRTLKLVEAVLDGAQQRGADTELVDICRLEIRYCRGCGVCYAEGTCVQEDDYADLLDKIVSADGIVFGSPVYINSVTAQLKTVIDRMADAIHCQMLSGKYGCAVTTAGGSGDTEVLRYMNYVLSRLGAVTVGEVGALVGVNPTALDAAINEAVTLGQTLADAIRTRRRYPDQEQLLAQSKEYFQRLIEANKDIWVHEYDYWKEKGWM